MKRALAAVLLGLSAISWLAAPAGAQWASASSPGGAMARSTTVLAPGTTTAACGLVDATIRVDWAPSPTPFVTQYEVRWGTSASSPENTTLVSGTTFTTPALGLGTWYFTVRSTKGAWRSPPSNQVQKSVTRVLLVALCT